MRPDTSSNMSQVFTTPFAFPPHKQPGSTFDSQRFEGYPPKEYPTSGTSSFPFSNRQYEGSGWNLSPGRLSMSEDQGKGGTSPRTGGDFRFESEKKLARESLPSLSSLFGTSAQSKTAQSPYSERQSPQFTTASPHETRPPPTPIHPDRSFDSGSFQRPSVSGPFSYTPRTDHVQRPTFPPPPRPGQPGLRPESPRYDSHYSPRELTRNHSTASSSRWSPSENPRPEYFPRDTSSSFKYQSEPHHPKQPQIHRSEAESSPVYREPVQNAPLTPNYPPTPASTVANEPVTTKDGLGPKIWTGTQFLPRFVRQAEVPGEGLCYFYDDNTHCKTVIDGEVVNAHWGVTKAGKPRKRLAIACITCREKKIKCDPDYPRCVQCEKFGRVCKFKNAPRGGQSGSPDTPPADAEDIITRPGSSRTEVEQFELETRASSHSVSPRTTLRRPTPDEESQQAKRRRLGYHDYTPVASEASPRLSMAQTTSPATSFVEQLTRSTDSGRPNEFQLNLLNRDSKIVPELLSSSLRNIRQIGYSMFPAVFESWVLSSVTKSGEDLMLIHAVLAVGAVLSSNPEYQAVGAEYACISRSSCSNSPLSLQLVQSRLLLAIYYNAVNKSSEAWEFCGSAIRAAYGLKMNLELERTDSATFAYGLNRSAHAECRRRTFWSCFIMDRLTSFSAGFPSAIDSEDVFLRLPCDSVTFDSQSETQAPFFNSSEPTSFEVHSPTHMMAYLISICTVWAKIASEVYRSSHQRLIPSAHQPQGIPSISRLRAWSQHLPSTHTFSPGNFTKSVMSGHLGTFTAMHAVYHFACMKLNRFFEENHDSRSPHAVYYIQEIRKNAADLLEMTKWASSNELLEVKKSSPFFTEAITTARQVLT